MVEHSPQILASEGKATMLRNQAVVDKTDTVLDIRTKCPGKGEPQTDTVLDIGQTLLWKRRTPD